MELYSKEELLKELKKEYSCGGECDHCPEVLDAGSCSVLRCIRRIIDNASPVDIKDRIAGAYNEGYMCGHKEAEKGRPQGEWIIDGHHRRCKKCGEYFCMADSEGNEIPSNFCPNCGAKMKGGAEND